MLLSRKPGNPMPSDGFRSLPPPTWLDRPFAGSPIREVSLEDLRIQIKSLERVSFLEVTVPGSRLLGDGALREVVRECYKGVGELVREMNACPIRFWNFIPGILRSDPNGKTNYECFNGGRFDAVGYWSGEAASENLAVATAVGATGDDYALQVLVDSQPARPVENPRQIPPRCYSRRYGTLPPVFARACLLTERQCRLFGCSALVSGTASIVGEDTRHRGDIAKQIDETCRNLAALSDVLAGNEAVTIQGALDRYETLRVYLPCGGDRAEVEARFHEMFKLALDLEFVEVDLCRPDLLLEAEGTLSFSE